YDATLTRSLAVPAGTTTLSFQARWNIEDCGPTTPCDYGYVEVDDGTGFKAIKGSITKDAEGNGIDGYQATYTPATFDLSAYAGKTIQLRLRYKTDGAAQGTDPDHEPGFFADEIKATNGTTTLFSDGAESGANGWTAVGWSAVAGSFDTKHDNFYIASNRTYASYDKYLQSGPYNFGFPTRPDWVEHFPYQNGLLVSYWDTSQSDNNESQHPGEGLILPIDAHPAPLYRIDGQPWRSRVQVYDAPFSLKRPASFTLHVADQPSYIQGQKAQPTFDDTRSYWDAAIPGVGVKVADAGVRIQVLDQSGTSMRVRVSPTK
ncbi:MAG: immune inhibitor A domain-containing protein, partial [Angustibacter sp.]